jgi:hypothetical protein
MISEAQLNHRFFVLGVLAAAIIPRHVITNQQNDNKGWLSTRIGGGMLSHNFRKILLVIAMVNLCRLFLSNDLPPEDSSSGRSKLISDVLGVLEVTLLTFLCFLTPYVLQVGLSQFFNIVPGSDLKAPLCASALLSFFGVALSRRVHPNFWALKKLANVASGPPVIRTLKSYNTFTTSQSHGRGLVLAQTLCVIEYWHLFLQLASAAAYAFNRHESAAEETMLDLTMAAARSIAFAADWTRVLFHATFLNQLEEMYGTRTYFDHNPVDGDGGGGVSGDGEEGGECGNPGTLMVPIRPRSD